MKRLISENIASIVVIIFISLIVSLPFLKPGFYTVHDDQQIARLYLFDEALKGGQIPVRWVSSLGFGFGYPLFNFYPPLVYAVGEIFHQIGFGFITSIKIVFFLSIVLSGFSIFFLMRSFWGSFAGITSAIFYILVPYRALDIYVRGALAESFSFVWLPLIIWSYLKLYQKPNISYSLFAGTILALLVVTHNLIFLPFLLSLFILFIVLLFLSHEKLNLLIKIFISLTAAFTLSAFFTLPALLEKKFTIVDDLLIVNLANYNLHFVYPQQLWNWTWGFGGSGPGLSDGISFKIGKLHIIIGTLASFFSIYYIFRKKVTAKAKQVNCLEVTLFVLFIFNAFMTTYLSKFIWDLLPPLAYLQFPWRFLTFTALFASILAGIFIHHLKITVIKIIFLITVLSLLIFTNLKLFRPQEYRYNLTDQKATSQEVINWNVSSSSFEYAPKGVPLKLNEMGANVIDIKKDEIPDRKLSIVGGVGKIDLIRDTPSNLKFADNNSADIRMTYSTFDFPGWNVYVDKKKVPHAHDNKFQLISFQVPSGYHLVEIKFENTNIRNIANIISMLSLITLTLYLIKNGRRRLSVRY